MSETIVELEKVSKHYKDFIAVNDLSLSVNRGDVFGFLGPNGAGKSTTMRMMLSLIKPTNGSIKIFGKELARHRNEIMRHIGCIIEKPDFYLYLSAEKNIEIFSRLSGVDSTRSQIHEVLEAVGLKGREKDKVKTYSHGMKQRLGIAQTLVHNPELIILDEPTTGLDPQGIIDVREMILRLKNEQNKTVILSSHILSEIEVVANHMIIVVRGKEIVQGEVASLLSTQNLLLSVETDDVLKVKNGINDFWKNKLHDTKANSIQFSVSHSEIPELVKELNATGANIFGVNYRRALEEYFLKLTSENSIK